MILIALLLFILILSCVTKFNETVFRNTLLNIFLNNLSVFSQKIKNNDTNINVYVYTIFILVRFKEIGIILKICLFFKYKLINDFLSLIVIKFYQ